jgi:ferredoxin
MKAGRVRVQEDSPFGCIACGHCMMSCPTNSITVTGRGISPKDLLPMPPAEERASARSLNALMLARRSVRRFKQEEVTHEDLGKIVAMALIVGHPAVHFCRAIRRHFTTVKNVK